MVVAIENSQNGNVLKRKTKKCLQNTFSIKTLHKRLPIIQWLPKYKAEYIIYDIIAGITVALTAIPQGIAYAVISGLSPEYGLYASLTSGVVYAVFGSCYNIAVGPTAILAAMTAEYVNDYSPDFAILAAFLAGVIILLLGVLNLGFLVEFISVPVIIGFTNAAALQIAATQLQSYFGLDGSHGNDFGESLYNFFTNIKTVRLWEPILATSTIIMLVLLQKLGDGCKRSDGILTQIRWFISLSRNAVVVIVGMVIAFSIKIINDSEPLLLIGDIGSGLPEISWPPLSTTTAGNVTLSFSEMVQILGIQAVMIPFVAILETVAIAKAFAEGGRIDATQELIAVGLCNIVGSCSKSLPITGSFTRTALNHVSGVKTPLGGVTNVLVLIVALIYLTSTFYYIPKASLAGLIITAMASMMNFKIFVSLWINSKKELLLLLATMIVSLFIGLAYGIITGVLLEALFLMYTVARPSVKVELLKCEKGDVMVVNLCENVSYCAAEHLRRRIMKTTSNNNNLPIILNGGSLSKLDFTAATNLMAMIKDLDKTNHIILLNFNGNLKKLCLYIEEQFDRRFVYASSPVELMDKLSKDV